MEARGVHPLGQRLSPEPKYRWQQPTRNFCYFSTYGASFLLLAVSVSTFAANVIVAVAVRKRTEVPAKELPADFPGQRVAIFERMAIVEASVDACQEDLVEEVACIVEGMCVEAVAECKAVHDDMHLMCSEVVFDQSGDCPGNTPVCGWIFRVAGSRAQGCPVGISSKV